MDNGLEFIWTDDLVKQYAEIYRFSSSRISVEMFKEGIKINGDRLLEGYETALQTNEDEN